MRSLRFKRLTALAQISIKVYYSLPFKMILELLYCTLQSILERGRFGKPLQKSFRFNIYSANKSNNSAKR